MVFEFKASEIIGLYVSIAMVGFGCYLYGYGKAKLEDLHKEKNNK